MKQKDILRVMTAIAAALVLGNLLSVSVEAQTPPNNVEQNAEISDDDTNSITNNIAICCEGELEQDISMRNSIEDNDVIGLDQNADNDPEQTDP